MPSFFIVKYGRIVYHIVDMDCNACSGREWAAEGFVNMEYRADFVTLKSYIGTDWRRKAERLAVLAAVLLAGLLTAGGKVCATSSLDLKREYEQRKKEAEANASTAKGLADEIREMNLRIADEARMIEILHTNIADLDEKVEKAEREQIKYEEELAVQKDYLYESIRKKYEDGNGDALGLFLGSKRATDFLDRFEYLNRVESYFDERMSAYGFMMEFVARQRSSLEEMKQDQEQKLIEYETSQSVFNRQVAELKELMDAAQKKADDANKFATELAAEIAVMEAEERMLLGQNDETGQTAGWNPLSFTGDGTDFYYVEAYPYTETELYLLAGIIQTEAGSSHYPGMVAVGSVVMNRVASSRFDNTIEGVIYASNQFEPVRTGRLAVVLASGPEQSCLSVAKEVLEGKRNVPNLYFKADWYAEEHGIEGVNIGGNVFH